MYITIKNNPIYFISILLIILLIISSVYYFFIGENGKRIGIKTISTEEKLNILNSLNSDDIDRPTTKEKQEVLAKMSALSKDLTADLTKESKLDILESLK